MAKEACPFDGRKPETIDGNTGQPEPIPRRIDLSNLRDIRIEMAFVYRRMDSGEIESREGTRRVYVLGEIGKILTVVELERRLLELEERQAAGVPGMRAPSQPARIN